MLRSRGSTRYPLSGILALAWAPMVLLGSVAPAPATAQEPVHVPTPASGYQLPTEAIQDLLDRDPNYAILDRPSPDGEHFLVPRVTQFSTLELMSKETYRLAMLEVRPEVDRQWHLDTWGPFGFRIFSLGTRRFTDVAVPDGAFLSDFVWSPDSRRVAFLAHLPNEATQVWLNEVPSGRAEPLHTAPVMATIGTQSGDQATSRMLQWTPAGSVITLLVPLDRGPEPARPAVATTPSIRHTLNRPAPTRTIPFLLEDEHEEDLFEHYTTSQIAELTPGQEPRMIGEPGMYMSIALSADGQHILATRIVRPFSFLTNYQGFPRVTEVLDLDGNVLAVLEERPLQLGDDDEAERAPSARDWRWRPDGQGLSFLRRDPANADDPDETRYDRVFLLAPPFDTAQAREVARSRHPVGGASHPRGTTAVSAEGGIAYSLDGSHAFATVNRGGREAIAHFALGDASAEPTILVEWYDPREVTEHPGSVLRLGTSNGIQYAMTTTAGDHVFLTGEGLKEDFRHQPFVDRVALDGGRVERLFEGSTDMWERPLAPLNANFTEAIIGRESRTTFPDSYLWSEGGEFENLTNNIDPFPEVTAARKVDFEFVRRDGVRVQGNLTLPVDYQEGDRVPAIFWTYPREHNSGRDYERAALQRVNHNAFRHLGRGGGSDIWAIEGYARIEPDIPIVSDETIGGNYNDRYISDLKDGMHAAIRAVDALGMVDVDRLAHGGHSYGGFATMNLLAHTPYFKAGIAGSGAYNRTLTPGGFQGERRTVWEAPQTYMEMSPFFRAYQIDTPLLMYHGADDNNTGTFPVQSRRMMHALTNLGKPAVLFFYPYESHGIRSMENVQDQWARWIEWLDRYVRDGHDLRAVDATDGERF
jgi:dienelactone hydrolase